MAVQKITTPRGSITVKNGRAELVWNPAFVPRTTQNFTAVQKFVDHEVLRYCSPLVPHDTGMLEKSGILGTEIGSGAIRYIAPYAAKQYYETAETRPYDANRGAKWFERMKVAHKDDILEGARKITKER